MISDRSLQLQDKRDPRSLKNVGKGKTMERGTPRTVGSLDRETPDAGTMCLRRKGGKARGGSTSQTNLNGDMVELRQEENRRKAINLAGRYKGRGICPIEMARHCVSDEGSLVIMKCKKSGGSISCHGWGGCIPIKGSENFTV